MRYSRRQFLQTLGGVYLGQYLLEPSISSFAYANQLLKGAEKENPRVLADLHVHPTLNKWIENSAYGVGAPLLAKIARTQFNTTKVDWKLCHEAGIDLMLAAHFN